MREMSIMIQFLVGLLAVAPATGDSVEAVTRPSQDAPAAFVRPGLIRTVHVDEGERVTEGQVLAELDDAVERIQLEQLQAQAKDTIRIEAAKAELAQKEVELTSVKEAHARKSATILEVQRAELDVQISELTVRLREFEHQQEQLKVKQARADLERMKLRSPISGIVAEQMVEQGEAVDALKPVLRITNIDPLWIDAAVPTDQARMLSTGDPAEVNFPHGSTRRGKIVYIASEADSASETLIVRTELSNPEKRIAGETVRVAFPKTDQPSPAGEAQTAPPPNAQNTTHTQNPSTHSES
jgi:RND family efflux transporter MFP subunit